MTRRDALLAFTALSACARRAQFVVEEATFESLRKAMAAGEQSCQSLTSAYLDRIEALDKRTINAVLEWNPDVMTIASQLDEERKAGKLRGPLHGIPILLKDNIDTGDKLKTTAGSLAMLDAPTPKDSGIAAKLRESGAVLLGKVNMSEWANIRSTRSTSGWSGRGGQTRNPYCLDRNPSGSSSGSGAAAAASFCAAAVGTETDGSIVSPSSINGLVGIKPTVGLLSGAGIIPISHTQDTAGPMARTVRDAALLLAAMAEKPMGELRFDPNGLKGVRLGVARKLFGANPDVAKLIENAIDAMKKLGAEVIDPADIPNAGKYDEDEGVLLRYELKAGLNKYLAARGGPMTSLKDVIDFNEKNRDKEMPYFGQETFLKAQELGTLTAKEYLDAVAKCAKLSRAEGIDAALRKDKLDAIIAPTDSPAWPTDWLNGDHFTNSSSTPPAVAGYPHITVPAGYVRGLPVGLSFIGTAWTEAKLITYAYAYEQATKLRKAPMYYPNLNDIKTLG
jgi:amidase